MLVRDHMSRRIVAVHPQEPVKQARDLMARHQIRHLPVVHGGKLVGIVSDRDVLRVNESVAAVMTPKPCVISADLSVDEAASLMKANRFSALPVVEKSRLIGILTTSDILRAFIDVSGVGEATTRIVVTHPGRRNVQQEIRTIVHHCRGELKWMHQNGRQIHLRLKVPRMEDIITELEAAGFEVTAVISSQKPAETTVKKPRSAKGAY